MAVLHHRHHGNFPQKRATLLPRVHGCKVQLGPGSVTPETHSTPEDTPEQTSVPSEYLRTSGFSGLEKESNVSCNVKSTEDDPSSEKTRRQPGKDITALLKTIRIDPEAQRILGDLCVPIVILQRLDLQSVCGALQPVVSLCRLTRPTQAHLHDDEVSMSNLLQDGFIQNESNVLEIIEASPEPVKPEDLSEISQSEATAMTSWTEPYCGEPEHDSGFDCESNPDQPYILFDDEWDAQTDYSDTFYLDPDSEQTLVIELNPEPQLEDHDMSLRLEDECEAKCDVDNVVEMDGCEDERPQQESEPGPAARTEQMDSEDFCAVCLTGGHLLCCDRCPKVYHLACHVPPLVGFPLGDWLCSLCRMDREPSENYDCERTSCCGGTKAPYTLSHQDQRRCEKLTLLLLCHTLSAPFHEPVSRLARNYYQIIRRPMDLSVIGRKLNQGNTLHYFTPEQFVDDVLLMFKNCATFNYPDSEVGQAGRSLELFFLGKLREVFPERTFQSASSDRTDRARLAWLQKRKDGHRKKRHVFCGKKYYL